MGDIGLVISETTKLSQKKRFQHEGIQEISQKLSSWREEQRESQQRLDELLSSYNCSIDKAGDDLLEEVNDLQAKLSAITEERNGLLVAVNKLSSLKMANLQIETGEPGGNIYKDDENDVQEGIKMCSEAFGQEFIEDGREQNALEQMSSALTEELDKSTFEKEVYADDMEQEKTEVNVDIDNDNIVGGELKDKFVTISLKRRPLNLPMNEMLTKGKLKRDQFINDDECSKDKVDKKVEEDHLVDQLDELGSSNFDNFADPDINNMEIVTPKEEAFKNAVHNKVKRHLCDECPFTSFRKENLKAHINGVHKNIRSHIIAFN